MVFASDGLVEGLYDRDAYNPKEGKFRMGVRFDPERMRQDYTDDCAISAYGLQKFVNVYQKKLTITTSVPKPVNLEQATKKMEVTDRSFSFSKNICIAGRGMNPSKESELQPGMPIFNYFWFRVDQVNPENHR